MSVEERQQRFEQAVSIAPWKHADARLANGFGFSNSSRVIEGGLFACTANLENYSAALASSPPRAARASQFVFLCVLTFPPQDEVYFAVVVGSDSNALSNALLKLHADATSASAAKVAAGGSPGKINNNVKVYLTSDGHVYLENVGFRNSLRPAGGVTPLDPDCKARIDSVYFTIWPPAVSARRSLLAREFVGYLGNLVSRGQIHEFRIWADPHTVKPSMQRLPTSIPVGELENEVSAAGGHYPSGEVRQLHAGLNFRAKKHFVILKGISGTGKTQLAIKYARAVHGLNASEDDPFLIICPVRPDWTDPTGLTGYYDVLSSRYVVPPFLEAILLATAHRDSPVFVVLDELNLARVEYYLSEVLSCLESGEALHLHSSGIPLEGSTGESIPSELPWPENLYLIGTINIDETTHPLSDKVLDRAMVIETKAADIPGFLARLETNPELAASSRACGPMLVAAASAMTAQGAGFGYRVVEEVVRYHSFVQRAVPADAAGALDRCMVQKVMAKLRGGEPQRAMLESLKNSLGAMPHTRELLDRLLAELDEFGSFQASR